MRRLTMCVAAILAVFFVVSTYAKRRQPGRVQMKVNRIEIVGDRAAEVKILLRDALKSRGYEINVASGDDINGECHLIEGEIGVVFSFSVKVRGRQFDFLSYTVDKKHMKTVEDLLRDVVIELINELDKNQKPTFPDPVPRLGGDESVFCLCKLICNENNIS